MHQRRLRYDLGTPTQVVQSVTERLVQVMLARHYEDLTAELLRRYPLPHQLGLAHVLAGAASAV